MPSIISNNHEECRLDVRAMKTQTFLNPLAPRPNIDKLDVRQILILNSFLYEYFTKAWRRGVNWSFRVLQWSVIPEHFKDCPVFFVYHVVISKYIWCNRFVYFIYFPQDNCTIYKKQKQKGFLTFSGVIEMAAGY